MGAPQPPNTLHEEGPHDDGICREATGVDRGTPLAGTVGNGEGRYTKLASCSADTWRCVALFHNNMCDPRHALTGEGSGGGSVPCAVNCMAWSYIDERLFTGDTDGMVKVLCVLALLSLMKSSLNIRLRARLLLSRPQSTVMIQALVMSR